MGLCVGLISFIPYVQVLGFLPAAVLALIEMSETGRSFWALMALVLLVYIVVQVLQDTIFTPRIMGKIMGLSPAMVCSRFRFGASMAGDHRADRRAPADHDRVRLLQTLYPQRGVNRLRRFLPRRRGESALFFVISRRSFRQASKSRPVFDFTIL